MKISNPIAKLGEDLATNYLKDKGYKIIERNFRKSYGEIDIIAVHKNVLVFIEVKTRTSNKFGTPFEAITFSKLRILTKTATFYKQIHPKMPTALRLDAISVLLDYWGNVIDIEHIENITK